MSAEQTTEIVPMLCPRSGAPLVAVDAEGLATTWVCDLACTSCGCNNDFCQCVRASAGEARCPTGDRCETYRDCAESGCRRPRKPPVVHAETDVQP